MIGIATPTIDFQRGVLEDYILRGLFVCLIDMPELGQGDYVSNEEYEMRTYLTLPQAIPHELPALNGYQRYIPNNPTFSYTPAFSILRVTATFSAYGGDIGPFTHALLGCGGDTYSASPSNGNGRGSTIGRALLVKACSTNTLMNGATYEVEIPVRVRVNQL